MNINVNLDFADVYELSNLSADFCSFQFDTILIDKNKNESSLTLSVEIKVGYSNFLPDVYNLAFGPLNEEGKIDDRIALRHKDNQKVYSTILFGALTFLNNNKGNGFFIGIDGSDIRRAYLYYKLLQNNYDYLAQFFRLIGVKYYIRLLRAQAGSIEFTTDIEDLATQPSLIIKGHHMVDTKLFNYFMFDLIQ